MDKVLEFPYMKNRYTVYLVDLPGLYNDFLHGFFIFKQKKMQEMGLEPTRYCYHRHLKPARLPIPPLLRTVIQRNLLMRKMGLEPTRSQ